MSDPTPTIGEQRVRLGSNPGAYPAIERAIKHAAAALIDNIHEAEGGPRLKALAMTDAESAAMWGVKAVNTGHPTAPQTGSAPDPAGVRAGGDPGGGACERGADPAASSEGAAGEPRQGGADPEPGSETGSGDPDELVELRAEVARLTDEVRTLDGHLATCRADRDAFAGKLASADRTVLELRMELDRQGPHS